MFLLKGVIDDQDSESPRRYADRRRGSGKTGKAAWQSPLKVDQAAFNRHQTVPSSSGRMLAFTGGETPVRIRAGQPVGADAALTAPVPDHQPQELTS